MKLSSIITRTGVSSLFFTKFARSLSSSFNNNNNNNIVDAVKGIEDVEWDDRIALQQKWRNEDKGWKVKVEWRTTEHGVGLFSTQDISSGTVLRFGINRLNLLQFRTRADVEKFINLRGSTPSSNKHPFTDDDGDNNNEEYYSDARLRYLTDYLWGFNPNADDRGYYDVKTDDSIDRFFGVWIPGNGLNHNLQPNTVYRAVTDGGTDKGINLVAIKDIVKGDELYDDYRRHGTAPAWLLDFAEDYGVGLNFA
eukprot:CAMPEP_0194198444 /NCGR_PEP_ID=MMETSP0154-20130528/77770_1 /TAXON_ID=1049557 /ORGANISM="Thalassiothrix antarctica, Strain L6-D1" /LENGTH=251 /DNA_ID=CAMNT_0038923239 /DNA_START=117 /DNA_END=869 /DNA_ORIENTATION=+